MPSTPWVTRGDLAQIHPATIWVRPRSADGDCGRLVAGPLHMQLRYRSGRANADVCGISAHVWAEIRDAKIAVFYLINNHDGADLWGARILAARLDIMRELGRRRKPFVAHITTEGMVNQVKLYYRKKTKTIHVARRQPNASNPRYLS